MRELRLVANGMMFYSLKPASFCYATAAPPKDGATAASNQQQNQDEGLRNERV
jgi:hypothetical protein